MKIILEGRNLSHRARELLVELEAELAGATTETVAKTADTVVETAATVDPSVMKSGRAAAGELVKRWVASIEAAQEEDTEITEGDRRALFASIVDRRALLSYLAQEPGAAHQLQQVGATPDIAANIITIGTIVGAWNFTH
jgi:glutamine synthetase adenylyltransferase